ncbi:undecaprenyl diphosphate synthase family protein [Garciella nitratireducens]|uniref:Undecaprenyl diphosphate synthase n=1 Tax=Garciella nitratireducens DSM 15102 TaxID=1121911 RepID=A0A1T4PN44_9FIRM|nr:undecaprenyl diphosphate synthase family protein [Garciella nitratireducens]SJZ93005.1 undecaprenyl diphosphate synthase [Garciella nitratireducens DSM 15102]
MEIFKRLPRHIGIIPDGNRRWAQRQGMEKQDGYTYGIDPGFQLYERCMELGIEEMTFYGFTQDNTKRPKEQTTAFQKACVDAVEGLAHRDAELLVIGNTKSPLFPKELIPYTKPVKFGKGSMRVNFLVNYGWNWDLTEGLKNSNVYSRQELLKNIASSEVSRIDLIIRWGGRRRLSGFLPIQSIYADFFVVEDYWPDFELQHLYKALEWYQKQDITLGG